MRVLDAGHKYLLRNYDCQSGEAQTLVFMKREGEGYPGNVGHYAGTNCQEVIRALIDRVLYLDGQIDCAENQVALAGLRSALLAFELRAARRHGRELALDGPNIEQAFTCRVCGHIDCQQDHETGNLDNENMALCDPQNRWDGWPDPPR
jgi:hypothetical protein